MYIIFSLKSKFGRDIFLDDLDCKYSTIVENCNLELDGIGILKNSISMLTANALSVTYTSGKGTFRKPLSISCLPKLGNLLSGILLPKLFWIYVRKNCCGDREKLLKILAEGREFANILRSLEQFFLTVKGQYNLWSWLLPILSTH